MATESQPIQLNVPCPSFELPGVDGKTHRLSDYSDRKVLVVAFTCNHCPYVQAYESRMIEFVKAFAGRGVSLICINSNDDTAYPDDSFEKMKARAKDLGFNFAYLRDQNQTAAKAFNAACTPEFYVYDSARKLQYHGRLDDSHKDAAAVKHRYLADAVTDLLEGKSVRQPQTAAMGCSIKWKKS